MRDALTPHTSEEVDHSPPGTLIDTARHKETQLCSKVHNPKLAELNNRSEIHPLLPSPPLLPRNLTPTRSATDYWESRLTANPSQPFAITAAVTTATLGEIRTVALRRRVDGKYSKSFWWLVFSCLYRSNTQHRTGHYWFAFHQEYTPLGREDSSLAQISLFGFALTNNAVVAARTRELFPYLSETRSLTDSLGPAWSILL